MHNTVDAAQIEAASADIRDHLSRERLAMVKLDEGAFDEQLVDILNRVPRAGKHFQLSSLHVNLEQAWANEFVRIEQRVQRRCVDLAGCSLLGAWEGDCI